MGETAIVMHFGDAKVHGVLDGTETARAFAEHLPTRIRVSGTGIDFCGSMPFSLPYEEERVGFGWSNGDINYNPDGGWFAILFDDEANSKRYGDQVNMGRVTDALDVFLSLSGSYDVLIEREGE